MLWIKFSWLYTEHTELPASKAPNSLKGCKHRGFSPHPKSELIDMLPVLHLGSGVENHRFATHSLARRTLDLFDEFFHLVHIYLNTNPHPAPDQLFHGSASASCFQCAGYSLRPPQLTVLQGGRVPWGSSGAHSGVTDTDPSPICSSGQDLPSAGKPWASWNIPAPPTRWPLPGHCPQKE